MADSATVEAGAAAAAAAAAAGETLSSACQVVASESPDAKKFEEKKNLQFVTVLRHSCKILGPKTSEFRLQSHQTNFY